MKKIEAIIRPEKMDEVQDALALADVHGMTVSQVHGCGTQHGLKEYYRGSEILVNMHAKIKIEVVVSDEICERIAMIICDTAYTGEHGDGKIFIFPVENAIRVRTRARGIEALQ